MPTIAGSAQQGQENTPPPVHPARQTLLGNGLAGSIRHSSCRVRNSSDMLAFPGFVTKCNVSFPTSPPEAAVPKMSPGATGITMGMVGKEPVVSVSSNQADAAVTMGPASGTPISPPNLTERTCRDLDTVGMLCGSPANPSSISKNAMESAAQSTAPSGASLRSDTGEVQSANDSVADSFHSSGQEGSNIEASIAKGGRARKPAAAVPLVVKTRSQLAQEKHLHRMQLRSG